MNSPLHRGLAIAGFVAGAAQALAQSVLPAESSAPVVPSSLRAAVESSPFALPTEPVETGTPLQWGFAAVKPHFSERFIYSDGIQTLPGQVASSHINSFSPGVMLDLGSHWSVDYTATWTAYSNPVFKDSLDHALNLAGGADLGDWLLQGGQTYASTNAPRVETGRQTKQEQAKTSIGLQHRFDNHWSLELGVLQDLQYIRQSPNYFDWSTDDWLTYRVVTRLAFSVGYRLGYTDFDPGAYMTYSQPQARVQWRATDKLTLSGQIGRDHRQVHQAGFEAHDSPSSNVSVQYQPFEYTNLSFSQNRSVTPAYLSNSVIEGRGWSAELRQRLLGHFELNTGYSEQKSGYVGNSTVIIAGVPTLVPDTRDDTTRSFHVRLGAKVLTRGTVSLIYERSRNESNVAGFSFDSHQVGCEFGYRF